MKVVEPGFEIWDIPNGEQALAKIERIGRIAYKSEDKIVGAVYCTKCDNSGLVGNRELLCLVPCDVCGGKKLLQEPSSHKFVRMILKAEAKAQMRIMMEKVIAEYGDVAEHHGSSRHRFDSEMAEELTQRVYEYMRENPAHESVIEHCSATVKFTTSRGITHELVRHRIGVAFTQESTRYCDYEKGKFNSQISVIGHPEMIAPGAHVSGLAEWEEAMKDSERHYKNLRQMGFAPQISRGALPTDLKADIVLTANFRAWRHVFNMRDASGAHPDARRLLHPLLLEFRHHIPIVFDDVGGE